MFYRQYLIREKMIFECLNKLTRNGNIVHGFVWSPLSKDKFMETFYGPEVSLLSEQGRNSARQLNLQIEEYPIDQLNPPSYF